jgi:hypothetical protein
MLDEAREEQSNEAPPWEAHSWPPNSNGQPVQSWRFVLTGGQKVWAVLVALAAIAGGLGSCAQGLLTYHDWACREGLPTVPCHMGQMDDNGGQ